jgi:hypothetical protein
MIGLLRSKRRQLLLTCFIFPILLPIVTVSIGLGAGMLLIGQSEKVGVMSESGGVSAGVFNHLRSDGFERALLTRLPEHTVTYFEDNLSAQEILGSGSVTYLIDGEFNESGQLISLQALWLKTKDYPQMHWLEMAEDALPWLANAYKIDRLGFNDQNIGIRTYSVGLGETSSNILFYAVTALLWMLLIYYAFDVLRGFLMRLYENEDKQDFLRHCICLKVPAYQIVFARLISMLPVIVIGVSLLFSAVLITASFYTLAGSAAFAQIDVTTLDRTAQTITIEFFDFYKSLQLIDGVIIFASSILAVMSALAIQQIFCVYTNSTDSARTYSKGLEITFISVPFIAMISGPYLEPYYPFIGIFSVLQNSLEGQSSAAAYFSVFITHLLIIILAVLISSLKSIRQ